MYIIILVHREFGVHYSMQVHQDDPPCSACAQTSKGESQDRAICSSVFADIRRGEQVSSSARLEFILWPWKLQDLATRGANGFGAVALQGAAREKNDQKLPHGGAAETGR